MAWWLKRIYLTESRKDRAYWETLEWVSDDPGRRSSRWKGGRLPNEGTLRPPWAPTYAIHDLLVIALAGDGAGRCPAIVRVTHEPCWEPKFVEEHGDPNDSDRWGVVTRVKKVYALDPHDGPTLHEIGVNPASTRRRGHLRLNQRQYERAERLITGSSSPSPEPLASPPAEFIPIEEMHVEGYDLSPPSARRTATRREQQLVLDYVSHLRRTDMTAPADSIGRYRIPVRDGTSSIYGDLFNASRNQLIEAKADISRDSIRMAIGQLADYAYHLNTGLRRAVLLPEPPEPELRALLHNEGMAVVWRDGDTFADDAGGAFV